MKYALESPPDARAIINSRPVDYFCGTGYLGLQSDSRVVQAACQAMSQYGLGSATGRSGYQLTGINRDRRNRKGLSFIIDGVEALMLFYRKRSDSWF